jgi:hypothetical protein
MAALLNTAKYMADGMGLGCWHPQKFDGSNLGIGGEAGNDQLFMARYE